MSYIRIEKLRSAEQIDTDTNEPWHLRGTYDPESNEIRLPVFDKDSDTTMVIIINNVSPFLGHPKTSECCQDTVT